MKSFLCALLILWFVPVLAKVTEIDLLKSLEISTNALGPHVVQFDAQNRRVIAACVNASALSIIDAGSHRLTNIPLPVRMPRWLHFQSVVVDPETGNIFLAAEKKLVIVNSGVPESHAVDLSENYNSLAVDVPSGQVLLVGRATGTLLAVDASNRNIKKLNWGKPLPPLPWKAATPPPPIRKILIDPNQREAYIIDGAHRRLIVVDPVKLEILRQREILVEDCPRWHLAGVDWKNHWIYLALEAENRAAKQVVRLNVLEDTDEIIDLPQMSREPQGICASIQRQEVYLPYDNHPYLHAVHFNASPAVDSIQVPRFGMDAAAVDEQREQLWVTNWAQGTLYRIDLRTQKLDYTIPHFPIFPHTNHLAFDPVSGDLFVPTGATAVNGTFGASLTIFNTFRNEFKHLPIGWGPVSLAAQPGGDAVYVFGSDKQFARIRPDGNVLFCNLPQTYPVQAIPSPDQKNVFVAYGPHSSIWPVPYIASTRHGIFRIGAKPTEITNLMTDRLAQKIAFDRQGKLWALQNTWGRERPFVSIFSLENQPWQRLLLPDTVENECVFRLLAADPELDRMYLARLGDRAELPGVLYISNTNPPEILAKIPLGLTPTDLCVQPTTNQIIVTNFDSDSVTLVNRTNFAVERRATGHKPLVAGADPQTGEIFVINHLERTVQIWGAKERSVKLPGNALPNNLWVDAKKNLLLITAHSPDTFELFQICPETGKVKSILKKHYPYGEITFDQANSAFSERGQWADAIFRLTDFLQDARGRLWISDYLSGKVWVLEDEWDKK